MEPKSVSVIIPAYNAQDFLRRAIESVLVQTYRDFEIIVVDDGSTDQSEEIVSSFGDRVRYIWQENRGLGGARNTGIRASQAEFIGLLDADDEWKPTYLEKMMLLARQHPEAAVYYCAARGMDEKGRELPRLFGRMTASNNLRQNLLRANFLIPSTILFRRSTIVEAGLFEEKNLELHGCEDWDLWLRLCPAHLFVATYEGLVRYRLHANTFSANPSHMQEAVRAVIEKNFGADDGVYETWSKEKRRAFAGVYRYRALTSVQKQGNWEVAIKSLCKAFEIDPTLALDLDLFYELAFGTPSLEHSDFAHGLSLEQNARAIMKMLAGIFEESPAIKPLRRKTYGTANYAIGLVAYNTKRRDLSRRFLSQALIFFPDFLLDRKFVLTLMRSYINPFLAGHLKGLAS